ncbi:FIMAH domain-containing protein [Sporosarcina sp. NPDC096371]|uniref:FIMAH domain-containing protein n=1 Tax=Sporosarcina sp. NPDC096371 TaxID=3364530 RepID=UPI003801334A
MKTIMNKKRNSMKKIGLFLLALSLVFATVVKPTMAFAVDIENDLSNDMRFSGTVDTVETPWGKGASFDGEKTHYLDSTTKLNMKDAFTLQFWFNIDSSDNKSNIMFQFLDDGSNVGRSVLYHRADKLGTYIDGKDIIFDEYIPYRKWVNAALKIDKAKSMIALYLNGEKVDEKPLNSSNVSSGNFTLRIGAHKALADPGVNRYDGLIDQIHVSNSLLSDDVILSNFENEKKSIVEEPTIPQEATTISIQPENEIGEIAKKMFGINHRYANDGYSSWDAENKQIFDSFEVEFKKANFGSVRYPGGTVSNLFEWKRSIGSVEDRKKTIHGLPYEENNKPLAPNFGLDEAARWLEENDSEMIYVYGMGNGSAQDAGDLVEYLNAEVGENPNGGIDWAQVRADNGHDKPYGVKSFELGNEMDLWIQDYWMSGNTYGSLLKAYVLGGEMDFTGVSTNNVNSYRLAQELVDDEDWRRSQRFSDASANQVKYIRYNPVVENSETILVDGKAWTRVDDLSTAGTRDVYEIDYSTGQIIFGDGVNGNIPPKGTELLAKYKTIQDGFNEIYKQMKAIDPDIKIYSGYPNSNFIDLMEKKYPYDGIAIHPYSGNSVSAGDKYLYEKIMEIGRNRALVDTKNLVDYMRKVSGKNLNAALSEFGIYNYNDDFISSQTHAIYIANSIIDFMDVGVDYINKHTLIDYPLGDSLGPGKQAVIQAFKQGDGTYEYVSTPSARVFELLNNHTGNIRVDNKITNNTKISDFSNVDSIKAFTSKSDDGRIYAFVVNTDRNNAKDLNLTLPEGEYISKVHALESESQFSVNTVMNPNNVQLEQLADIRSVGNMFTTTIEPHSIKVFEITEGVDKSLLEAKLTEAKGVDTTGKTKESVQKLNEAIAAAQVIIDDKKASQAAVDAQVIALEEAMNGLVEEGARPSAIGIKQHVQRFEKEGDIKDNRTARALTTHLTAVVQYEKQAAADKVIKHMQSFKLLLDQQLENQLISDKANNALKADADALIQQWQ